MSETALFLDVKKFVHAFISSVEQIEILLVLKTAFPVSLDAAMIAKELRGNETSVLSRLKVLAQTGLIFEVAPSMLFQFSPKSDELTARVNSLLECYSTHKVKIIEMIYTERSNGISDFSNSFYVKGDK